MVVSRYAGVGQVCHLFDVEVVSGGNISNEGEIYLSFQLQNRAGFNIPSVSGAIAYQSGQKIVITIPESVRADGWDIHYFIVSAGTTDNPATHVQIAGYSGFEYGVGYEPQSVRTTLPATIELSEDEHILLAPSIADLGSLPHGVNRIDRQIRWVTSESKWFQYRADSQLTSSADVFDADIGQWVRVGAASSYVIDTKIGMGSDRPLNSILPTSVIPTPPYPGETLTKYLPQWESQYWIINSTPIALPAGTEFGIELEYNNRRSPDLLSGLFMVKFLGFVRSDGTIRTQDSQGRNFPNVGAFFPWTPKVTTPFITIDALQPGEAIALAVKPFFSVAELNGQVSPKDIVGVIPVIRTQSGDFNPLGKLLPKGTVYPNADRYRVVPNVGLIFDILSGHAIVGGYDFPVKPKRTYSGLQPNLSGQKIIINGNAAVYAELPSYTPSSSEALRALVSTEPGESVVGEWSDYVSASGLILNLSYPNSVRADYPDVIANNNKAAFNPPIVNIYIQREDTLEIRKFSGFLAIASAGQEFTISNWDSGTISSLPVAGAEFSLFAPGDTAIAPTSGNFPATNFRATYSFEYDGNQISAISHISPPCIEEWLGNFQAPSVQVVPGVIQLAPGEPASVTNIGDNFDLNLLFSFPSGNPGEDGDDGIDGIDGKNAFTITTGGFFIPAIGNTAIIGVLDSEWISEDQFTYFGGFGTFRITNKPSTTSVEIINESYPGNAEPGTLVPSGVTVSPSGAPGPTGLPGQDINTLIVQDIASLRLLDSTSTPARVNEGLYPVLDSGEGVPSWYLYKSSETDAEDLPAVVAPSDDVGRYLQFNSGGNGGGSGFLKKIVNISADYTMQDEDRILIIPDYTQATWEVDITLPENPQPGWEIELIFYINTNAFILDENQSQIDPTPIARIYPGYSSISMEDVKFMGQVWTNIEIGMRLSSDLGNTYPGGRLAYVNDDFGWYVLPPEDYFDPKNFRYYNNS